MRLVRTKRYLRNNAFQSSSAVGKTRPTDARVMRAVAGKRGLERRESAMKMACETLNSIIQG